MQLKREGKVNTVFTRDGVVHVVIGERDRPRPVRCDAALERISREVAELAEAGRPGQPSRRDSRSDETTGASRSDGGREMAHSPPRGRDHVAAGPAGASTDTTPVRAAEAAGRGAERREGAEPGGSVVRDEEEAELARRRRSPSSPGAGDRPERGRGCSLPGERGTNRSPDTFGRGGGGYAGAGDGDGGERRGTDVSTSQSAVAEAPRLAAGGASVRRRCGADIRQFLNVHSKCD
ncbi:hypothetical protein FJT64_002867 [Amphibalanus amphitrite]|uniref:Uncharacterized protein n=1 Tax=Amphibalanus amphitrite TaxID=1232801 RepID=A0A6A4W775_AMPAM|nr:hypothetical protein FJT64_002867 [Amphibalanus amphitrite]